MFIYCINRSMTIQSANESMIYRSVDSLSTYISIRPMICIFSRCGHSRDMALLLDGLSFCLFFLLFAVFLDVYDDVIHVIRHHGILPLVLVCGKLLGVIWIFQSSRIFLVFFHINPTVLMNKVRTDRLEALRLISVDRVFI